MFYVSQQASNLLTKRVKWSQYWLGHNHSHRRAYHGLLFHTCWDFTLWSPIDYVSDWMNHVTVARMQSSMVGRKISMYSMYEIDALQLVNKKCSCTLLLLGSVQDTLQINYKFQYYSLNIQIKLKKVMMPNKLCSFNWSYISLWNPPDPIQGAHVQYLLNNSTNWS